MFCSKCGTELVEGSEFCFKCGTAVNGNVNGSENKKENKNETEKGNNSEPKRTKEFVLGLVGGLLGIVAGFVALFFGELFTAFGVTEHEMISNLGVAAILFSILGIVGACLANTRGKISGLILLTAAIGGLISISLAYTIPFILLIIPAIMGLTKKNQNNRKEKWWIWIPLSLLLLLSVFYVSFESNGNKDVEENKAANEEIYLMKEEVKVGNLTYIIKGYNTKEIVSDSISDYKPNGIFMVFTVAVRNDGLESQTIDSSLFELIAPDGSVYSANTTVTSALNEDGQFFLNEVNPKNTVSGKIAFDVPSDNTKYLIQVSGGMISADRKLIKMVVKKEDQPVKETQATVITESITVEEKTEAVKTTEATEAPTQNSINIEMGEFLYDNAENLVGEEQYLPKVVFSEDGTFKFAINLYDGMGECTGTYLIEDEYIYCTVTAINFSGYSAEDVKEFTFLIQDENTLVYSSSYLGLTGSGHCFIRN